MNENRMLYVFHCLRNLFLRRLRFSNNCINGIRISEKIEMTFPQYPMDISLKFSSVECMPSGTSITIYLLSLSIMIPYLLLSIMAYPWHFFFLIQILVFPIVYFSLNVWPNSSIHPSIKVFSIFNDA